MISGGSSIRERLATTQSRRNSTALIGIPEQKSVMLGQTSEDDVTLKMFHAAAAAGRLAEVRRWVEAGRPADATLPPGRGRRRRGRGLTALHRACIGGQVEVAKYLVREGRADPGRRGGGGGGLSALQHALWAGTARNVSIVKMLMEHAYAAAAAALEPGGGAGATPAHLGVGREQRSARTGRSSQSSEEDRGDTARVAWRRGVADAFLRAANRRARNKLSKDTNLFIRKEDFIEAGRLLPFIHWEREGKHVRGSAIAEDAHVLFVSHRWETVSDPDPSLFHFEKIVSFLKGQQNMDYIWIDFSCITQDKTSDVFRTQLVNMITVMFQTSHVLILPSLVPIQVSKIDCSLISKEQIKDCKITDLNGYLGRAWCKAEALAALMLGVPTFCLFQCGPLLGPVAAAAAAAPAAAAAAVRAFVRLPARTDVHDPSGLLANDWYSAFEVAAVFSLPPGPGLGSDGRLALWEGGLRAHWRVDYDRDVSCTLRRLLGLFRPTAARACAGGCQALPKDPHSITNALRLSLTMKDLQENKALRKKAKMLGQLTFETDRPVILQSLILIFAYASNMLSPAENNKSSSKEVESSLQVNSAVEGGNGWSRMCTIQ